MTLIKNEFDGSETQLQNRVKLLKTMLYSCRWAYVKLLNPKNTMGECFPSWLRNRKGAQDYVQTFLVAFNQANLTQGKQHVLRTCCLLAMPPPSPGMGEIIITPGNPLSSHGGEYKSNMQSIAASFWRPPLGSQGAPSV